MEWFGVALIFVASVLFVADLKVMGHGLPSLGGLAVLMLGISLLFNPTGFYLLVSLVALVAVTILMGVFFVRGLSEARAAQGRPVNNRDRRDDRGNRGR